ncbi:MAG: hypothetical protein AAFP00_08945, partial [Bacteroidota bacterium]
NKATTMNKPIGAFLSPGHIYGFDFIYAGEIRFGPPYYHMVLQGKFILDRIFGFEFKWDDQARYLALQEWLLGEASGQPLTALSIIDTTHQKISLATPWDRSLIFPIEFKEEILSYEKEYIQDDIRTQHQLCLTELTNWTDWKEG